MTAQRRGGAAGFRWEKFKRLVFQTYGTNCYICHHGGARQVDHLESVTEHPELALALSNCRPAHGAPGNACPVCSSAANQPINCNQLRGGYGVERAREIIAERIAGNAGKRVPDAWRRKPKLEKRPEPPADTGRPW